MTITSFMTLACSVYPINPLPPTTGIFAFLSATGNTFSVAIPSPLKQRASHFRGVTSQCSGTSPSHSTPEGLSLGWGSKPALRASSGGSPRVTVCEIRAVRFSLSRSIKFCFFATRVSIFSVSRSRKSAIVVCSERGGRGMRKSLQKSGGTRFWPPAPYIEPSP